MQKSFQAMAQRIENARNGFADTLVSLGDISRKDAERLTEFYLKKRLAKLDPAIGRINVKHGAYLERDVIRRAVEMA